VLHDAIILSGVVHLFGAFTYPPDWPTSVCTARTNCFGASPYHKVSICCQEQLITHTCMLRPSITHLFPSKRVDQEGSHFQSTFQ
jgi:hypothetical protein